MAPVATRTHMKAHFHILLAATLLSVATPVVNAATSATSPVIVHRYTGRSTNEGWMHRHMARMFAQFQQEQLRAAQSSSAAALNAIRSDTAASVEQNMTTLRGTSLVPAS